MLYLPLRTCMVQNLFKIYFFKNPLIAELISTLVVLPNIIVVYVYCFNSKSISVRSLIIDYW